MGFFFPHSEGGAQDLLNTEKLSHQLLVHQRLVVVYAVELVLEDNLRQAVVEELPGEQRRKILEGGSDVSRPF